MTTQQLMEIWTIVTIGIKAVQYFCMATASAYLALVILFIGVAIKKWREW